MEAAQRIDSGVDMRTFNYDGEDDALRWNMQQTCLPLPCHTQFVESGVKEAKIVASTDRSEEQRTCVAIIRAGTPLGFEGTKAANRKKIVSIIESARARATQHMELHRDQGDEHLARFNQVVCSLSKGHYKLERVEDKKTNVDTIGATCRKQNAAQRVKHQHLIPAVTGLTPHTRATQKRNKADMWMEIRHRQWQLNYQGPVQKGMKERKTFLQRMESIRLIEEQGMTAGDAVAHKSFLIQSEAEF